MAEETEEVVKPNEVPPMFTEEEKSDLQEMFAKFHQELKENPIISE